MSPEASLLQSLHASPADDTAWLALADCLEEQGDPRAEVLRLRLALGPDVFGEARCRAERRLWELLAAGVRPCVPVLRNAVGMELALVPPGTFFVGKPPDRRQPEPPNQVTLTRPFYLGVHPVTQAQFQQVMGANPSHFAADGPGRDQMKGLDTRAFPVDSVTWDDAVAFCDKLSALPAERAAGRVYRLPTEAEWEYAARAGAACSTPYHCGDALTSTWANFDGNYPDGGAPKGPYLQRTTAVGGYPPNAFGLYDMLGNVWEWCHDWFDDGTFAKGPAADPTGPRAGHSRVMRGGSWFSYGWVCKATYREKGVPDRTANRFGFRVALSPPAAPPASPPRRPRRR